MEDPSGIHGLTIRLINDRSHDLFQNGYIHWQVSVVDSDLAQEN